MVKELIDLYKKYLNESIKERTIELYDLEKGGKKTALIKGNFDGFMCWLKVKNELPL